jgi:hypothetical protein
VLFFVSSVLALSIAPTRAQSDERCFDEVEYCISGRIREYWEQQGGLPFFGFPISPQEEMMIEGQPVEAQWFERNRLELHPENTPPYDVLLGRLGVDVLAQQGRDWQSFPTDDSPAQGCLYFEQTGQNVCGDILAVWQSSGVEIDGVSGTSYEESLAFFGLPISPLQAEEIGGETYQVQWFERARFELHPENDPPYHVLLGRLGDEVFNGPPGGGNGGEPQPSGISLGYGLSLVTREHEEEVADPQFTLTTSVPSIEGTSEDPAASFNQAVDGLVRGEVRDFADMIADWERLPEEPPYSLSISHEVVTTANSTVSILFTISTYTGGAHPNHYSRVINFSLLQSEVVTLDALFEPGSDYLGVIADYCIAELGTRDVVFPDFESGALPTEENYSAWNIDEEGVLITFDPYQVAPYAAGMQQVMVPYSELADIIRPGSLLELFSQ